MHGWMDGWIRLCLHVRINTQRRIRLKHYYWSTVCLSCLVLSCPVPSVCNVGVLWPNGCMDKDGTLHEGRPRPGHIVLDGDPAPPQRAQPPFSAHVCCGQTAGWIKIPLGTEVGLRPDDIVLHGDPDELSPPKGSQQPPHFSAHALWPNAWMDQDAT